MEENLRLDQKRKTAWAPFAGTRLIGFRGVSRMLLIVLVFVIMALPLFTTFNEILTRIVENTGLYTYLTKYIVPFETRAVFLILKPFGIKSIPTASHLFMTQTDGISTGVYFSWNCLGWQSVVLLVLSFATGLSGNYSLGCKVETILLGITGTFLINLVRISVVVVIAYYFGQLPATIVHDYGGTLFTIGWFFFYWYFSYSFILDSD